MPLHPQIQAIVDETLRLNVPEPHTVPPEEARQVMRSRAARVDPARAVEIVEDRVLPGPGGDLPIRLYRPSGAGPFAGLVYFHGGGWVVGDLDTHDSLCHSLAHESGCSIVSVDYRLAPEHRFPAALDDSYAATEWVAANGAELGIDPSRLAVGGDSAGGNLAAAVALLAQERNGPTLRFQLLIYPVTDHDFDTASYSDNATGYLLSRDAMRAFWDEYVPDKSQRDDPHASPLRATDLSGQPPAFVLTAGYDPLRDEGVAYARRLEEAGVPVTHVEYPDVVHGFIRWPAKVNPTREAQDRVSEALREALL